MLSTCSSTYNSHTSLVLSQNPNSKCQFVGTRQSNPIVVQEYGNSIQSLCRNIQISLSNCDNLIPIYIPQITSTSLKLYIYIMILWLRSFNYFIYNKCDQYFNIHPYTRITMKKEHAQVTQTQIDDHHLHRNRIETLRNLTLPFLDLFFLFWSKKLIIYKNP